MANRNVVIFTFNDNENTAVQTLLASYLRNPGPTGGTIWQPAGLLSDTLIGSLPGGRTAQIQHRHLRAQGNVTAATELARAATGGTPDSEADVYIVYACCGAINEKLIGNIYRVSRAAYVSLGSVKSPESVKKAAKADKPATSATADKPEPPRSKPTGGKASEAVTETVTLKNFWFVRTEPTWVPPLGTIDLPTPPALQSLKLPEAFVLATDKVIQIPPAPRAPKSKGRDIDGRVVYDPSDKWTYGQALAHCKKYVPGPILIDMETYGIASIMRVMGLRSRVLVLRVVTDALENKDALPPDYQLTCLLDKRLVLQKVLDTIIGIR